MATKAATKMDEKKIDGDGVSWLSADKDYGLGIEAGKLVSRNPAGKRLASVPKELKESDLGEQLLALCEWLEEHRNDCLRRIVSWMLRSLPAPFEVIRSTWPDPDWSDLFRNLVVAPLDAQGNMIANQTGLLRDVDSRKGIGIVDRDGETQWLAAPQVLIPHPILIDGLAELREIAVDMNFSQSLEQIFRPIFPVPAEKKEESSISEFSGGKFDQLNFVSGLSKRLGYPVRGGYACTRIWENARPIEARFWIGADSPEAETYTGDLIFVDRDQKPLKIGKVGRVAFSEGVRMASQIFAKRKIEKPNEDPQ